MPRQGRTPWFETPTQHSRPRRVRMDPQDRLYFGEYQGNKIGMLDTKTRNSRNGLCRPQWTAPYYVTWDKNGELWTGGMTTDRAVRLNPKTGQTIEYLMPKDTNHAPRVRGQYHTPVTFWTGKQPQRLYR